MEPVDIISKLETLRDFVIDERTKGAIGDIPAQEIRRILEKVCYDLLNIPKIDTRITEKLETLDMKDGNVLIIRTTSNVSAKEMMAIQVLGKVIHKTYPNSLLLIAPQALKLESIPEAFMNKAGWFKRTKDPLKDQALCIKCNKIPVDIGNGYDTCPDCLAKLKGNGQ